MDQIKTMFPFEGRKNVLELHDIQVEEPKGRDPRGDLAGQKKAKLFGRTWSVPVYADLVLKTKDGRVLDKQRTKILDLPQITNRFSYIVKGSETQIAHQWRLKSGVYTRKRENGVLESQFNLAKGFGFDMVFDPESRNYNLEYKNSKIGLKPVMNALGVSDKQLSALWGPEILAANVKRRPEAEVLKLAKVLTGKVPTSIDGAVDSIKKAFDATELRADTTALTLGEPVTKVGAKALGLSSRKLLSVSRGESEVDTRDSLQFKELWGLEDQLPKRLADSSKRIRRQVGNNLDRRKKVRDIMATDIFNLPISAFFTTGLVEQSSMTNPVDIVSGQRKTTITGPGGISSAHSSDVDSKLVDPSHLGYIDPIPTPEGSTTGMTTFLSIMAERRNKTAHTKMFNTKTNKLEMVTPSQVVDAVVAFPDQYSWDKGKPTPIGKTIKASGAKNELEVTDASKVDYILPSARGLFTLSTNMIPFLQNDQGTRANYASKQISQAISLKNPEAPLVQAHTGGTDTTMTWEKLVGSLFSHKAPADGVVKSVGSDVIKLQTKGGVVEIPIYRNYPLNDGRSMIDAAVTVKKGDVVKKGDLVSDTNFTKDGVLSLGRNLRVAYIPLGNLTFEDGVVISETAAKKLTSEHLYQERLFAGREVTLNKAKYRAERSDSLTDEQADKLDDDGVILVGQRVMPGDTLVAALRKSEPGREQVIMQGIHKALVKRYRDSSLVWEKDIPGVVEEVVRHGREIKVHVKTEAPAQVGDKLSGRHGNKGVISRVLPDAEMPMDADGEPMEIILNPSGVPGRINPGQVYETVMGKVAKKKGGPVAVTNFEGDHDRRIVKVGGHWRTVKTKAGPKKVYIKEYEYTLGYHDAVMEQLEEAGVSDREPLYDPTTKEELTGSEGGGILTGFQYILKLEHTSEKKLSARGQGAGLNYDANLAPKGGGKTGAQSLGALGLYAMLAHGESAANLREMQTVKSDRSQDDFWAALQAGEMLPTPKAPFAFEKFVSYLNALGVNVRKEGHDLHLMPMLDKEILEQSNGELASPNKLVIAKNLKPEKGGLFDEEITGGLNGSKWSHIALDEAIPNPMFENAVKALLGMTGPQFMSIMNGTHGTNEDGKIVEAEDAARHGGNAIGHLLGKIQVAEELEKAEDGIKTAAASNRDKLNKKIKYLRTLKKLGATAEEAYMLENIPVIPPRFRPLGVLESGDLNIDDLNGIYHQIGINLTQLQSFDPAMPDEMKNPLRAEVYDGVKSLAGLGGKLNAENKGILDIISGGAPKHGFFQAKLLKRKQDLTMRAVIVPSEGMALDEVGLPRKAAMTLFTPFVVNDLVRIGYTPLEAREEVKKKSVTAQRSLDNVVNERPVLLKRDPALHKFNVMAFRPKLVPGDTIHLHPLAVGGYNADFDGDQMAVFVPVTEEAVREAYTMLPSKNLFNVASGIAMYQPTLESQLGLFNITRWEPGTGKKFASVSSLLEAAASKKIPYTEVVTVKGTKTTAGRLLVSSVLPDEADHSKLLKDPKFSLGTENLQSIMKNIALAAPDKYADSMDKLKDIGFNHSYKHGWTLPLEHLIPLRKIRDKHVKIADRAVALAKGKGMKGDKLSALRVKAYTKATDDMEVEARAELSRSGNNLYRMNQAGVKPSWGQLRQLLLAPMLLNDAKGKTFPIPVTNSYSDGLDVSEYWIASHGARKGIMDKTQEVQKPGYLTKQIANTVLNMVVTEDDCGTDQGVHLSSSSRDLLDRFTSKPIRMSKGTLPAGTVVTPAVLTNLKASGLKKVMVRSALRCRSKQGMCAKCFGVANGGKLPKVRDNLGITSGQAVGERSTQLAMRTFHCNHADSLVFVKDASGDVSATTMEELFSLVGSGLYLEGDEQVKEVKGLRVWDSGWVQLTHVRRHAPKAKMVAVGAGGDTTICQDNHPIGVRRTNVSCVRCGYHRLKPLSPAVKANSSAERQDYEQCPKCHKAQPPQPLELGGMGFIPPAEIEVKKHYLTRSVPEELLAGSEIPEMDPYVAGLYVAEGSVDFRRSHKGQKEKKPYSIAITQNDGPVKDRLLEKTAGWNPRPSRRGVVYHGLERGVLFHSAFGRYSFKKKLPAGFMSFSHIWLRGFLCGLIDGDGTAQTYDSGPDTAIIDTTSFALVQQVLLICKKLDIHAWSNLSTLRENSNHQGFKVRLSVDDSAYEQLSGSLKVASISTRSPEKSVVLAATAPVGFVREVLYTDDFVYDATTETGTLFVSSLKHHNTGGVAGAKGGNTVGGFERLNQILMLPKKLKGAATLSGSQGNVSSILKDPAGGWRVNIGSEDHYVPQDRTLSVKKGDVVQKGQPLSSGPVDPKELLGLTNVAAVQNYMVGEMAKVYKSENLKRRNFEVIVKAMTNLSKVTDSGGHPEFVRQDLVPTSLVSSWNRENPKSAPVKVDPILKGLNTLPLDSTKDWAARMNFQGLKKTLQEGASRGWKTDLHGTHPVPGLMFGAEFGKPPSDRPWAY